MKKFYQIALDAKQRAAGRFLTKVLSEVQLAFADEKVRRGLTQQKLADALGVDRSVVNRRLLGESNLTLRSVAEMAYCLDREIVFSLRRKDAPKTSRNESWSATNESLTKEMYSNEYPKNSKTVIKNVELTVMES